MRVQKTYNTAEYVGEWYADDEIDITIDGTSVTEDIDSSSGNKIKNESFSRDNWKNYIDEDKTTIKDKMNINHQITFEGGSVSDDDKTYDTATVVQDWGTQLAINSDGSTFPTNDGFIRVNDEFIFYGIKAPSGANYLLTNLQRGYAHTVEPSGGHSASDVVTDMTDSAEHKKYQIETLRIRGGTIYIWWRNHRYEGLITKMTFTDSKEKHTGGLSRVTRYYITITFRIGTMP